MALSSNFQIEENKNLAQLTNINSNELKNELLKDGKMLLILNTINSFTVKHLLAYCSSCSSFIATTGSFINNN